MAMIAIRVHSDPVFSSIFKAYRIQNDVKDQDLLAALET